MARNISIDMQANGQPLRAVAAVPLMSSGGHIKVVASGASFEAFPMQPCLQLTIAAPGDVDIEVQQGGGGVAFPISGGQNFTFFGLADASDLAVRRVDLGSAVDVVARWEG